MKKLKLLPSVLMLVLCLGVLAVGIYAIQPTQNQITGTVTITASNAAVEIDLYKSMLNESGNLIGEETKINTDTYIVRNSATLDFGRLEFMAESGVKSIAIRFDVKNNASKSLGMYFAKSASTTVGEYTTADLPIAGGKITASFSNYTELPSKGNSDDAVVTFTLNSREDEDVTIDETAFRGLNIYFNLEDWNETLIPAEMLNPQEGSTTLTKQDYIDAGSPAKIIIPDTVTSTLDEDSWQEAFTGCLTLKEVTLGSGLTSMPDFSGCTNLTKVIIPAGFGAECNSTGNRFEDCPNISFEVSSDNGSLAHDTYGNLINKEGTELYVGSNETEMNLDGKYIDQLAFSGRTNLQTLSLNGCNVREGVFDGCTALSRIVGVIGYISYQGPIGVVGTLFISSTTGIWNDYSGLPSDITYYTDVADEDSIPVCWYTGEAGEEDYGGGFVNYASCTINYGWTYERYASEILGIN